MAKWKEIRKHLFSEFSEGYFSPPKPKERRRTAAILLGIFLVMTFFWLTVNAPVGTTEVQGKEVVKAGGLRWRWLGLSYALFVMASLAALLVERIHPEKTHVVAFPKFKGDFGISGDVIAGLLAVIGTSVATGYGFAATGKMAFFLNIFPEIPWINLIIVGISIPIAEEFFFGCLIGGTMIENFGAVTGTSVASMTFALFHFAAYGLSGPLLLPIFLFRVLACAAMIATRSAVGGLVGHATINSVSTVTAMVM